jgi:copper chaperone CopZ
MTHTYKISGMTCGGCQTKVQSALSTLPDVTSVDISLEKNTATISMQNHISLPILQQAIGGPGSKYQMSEIQD